MDFLVKKGDIASCHVATAPELRVGEGQVLLRLEKWAFTANNVTYAVAGEMLYWAFFPHAPDPEALGRIPVWGIGRVCASRCAGVAEGERVYGYFPMSSFAVLQPRKVVAGASFSDGSAQRAALPAVYNSYVVQGDSPGAAFWTPQTEDLLPVYQPLFATAWGLDQFLAAGQAEDGGGGGGGGGGGAALPFFGADTVLLSSASSKTSYCLAFLLSLRRGDPLRPRVVGLTSAKNARFVQGLGVYDEVVEYGAAEAALAMATPAGGRSAAVLVDMAGNVGLRARLHRHYGDGGMVRSVTVGMTHWDKTQQQQQQQDGDGEEEEEELPGATPKMFFAPSVLMAMNRQMGAEAFGAALAASWRGFVARCVQGGWCELVHVHGSAEGVKAVYTDLLAGRANPAQGHLCSLPPVASSAKL